MKTRILLVLILAGAFGVTSSALYSATMTLTGEVGDAACGVKHMMSDRAHCTAACVAKGSDYALIVGDKAYTLKATAEQKAELAKMAGKMAMVTGEVDGNTITIATLMMAKGN